MRVEPELVPGYHRMSPAQGLEALDVQQAQLLCGLDWSDARRLRRVRAEVIEHGALPADGLDHEATIRHLREAMRSECFQEGTSIVDALRDGLGTAGDRVRDRGRVLTHLRWLGRLDALVSARAESRPEIVQGDSSSTADGHSRE